MSSSRLPLLLHKATIPALLIALVVFACFPWLGNALRWPGRVLFFAAALVVTASVVTMLIRSFRKPKYLFFGMVAFLLAGLLVYGFLEIVAWLYLKADPNRNADPFVLTSAQREAIERLVHGEPDYTTFDSTLGWAIKGNGVSADGRYRANADGFRADREYDAEIPGGVRRIVCFGDSYTHGNSVRNDETWQHYAAEHRADTEVLNFGVGGYGMAQAYLRYRERKDDYETDIVVIGCMSDNIRRTVNVFYPFRLTKLDATTFALAKPWASLDADEDLVLHPNPLPSLEAYAAFLESPGRKMRQMAKQDLLFQAPAPTPLATVAGEKIASADFSWFIHRYYDLLDRDPLKLSRSNRKSTSPFSPGSEIFRINCRLFESFVAEVEAHGDQAVILWFPSPKDVARYNQSGTRIYGSFLDHFDEIGLPWLDSLEWISEKYGDGGNPLPAEAIFVEGHYSPPVNRLIGEKLVNQLDR